MSFRWIVVLACALSFARAQNGYSRDRPLNQLGYNAINDDDNELSGDEIPGEAGRDYPVYSSVPRTGFSCNNQQYPGYYADPEAQCQAFYICRNSGRGVAALCPNGTIFNQELLVCDWWYNFDCDRAEQYYSVNEAISTEMEQIQQQYNNQDNQNYNQRPSETYGVPGQSPGRPLDRYNQRNGNGFAPKPVYGPPSANVDRTYLPPSQNGQNGQNGYSNNQAYRNGLGNGPSTPDRSYLPPTGNGYRNGNRPSPQYGVPSQGFRNNGQTAAFPGRSYLPPSK